VLTTTDLVIHLPDMIFENCVYFCKRLSLVQHTEPDTEARSNIITIYPQLPWNCLVRDSNLYQVQWRKIYFSVIASGQAEQLTSVANTKEGSSLNLTQNA